MKLCGYIFSQCQVQYVEDICLRTLFEPLIVNNENKGM